MQHRAPNPFYRNYIKAPIDIIVAAIAIIILSPVYIILYLLLYRSTGGDVWFVQERVGNNEKRFSIYKYRTMNNKRGPDNELLPDAERPHAHWQIHTKDLPRRTSSTIQHCER